MFTRFFRTEDDSSALVLRLMLAIVFFPHGAQKVLGWFGGHGLEGTINYFTQSMGFPLILAVLVIVAEFLGPIGLFFGFLTRLAALGIACVMVGAIFMVHLQHGFFMNWQGNQAGEGFEYHLLAIAIAVALMIKGGGRWSVDGIISRNL
ncbi:MAG: DoxX family protein [Desulfuromonadales bacterium]